MKEIQEMNKVFKKKIIPLILCFILLGAAGCNNKKIDQASMSLEDELRQERPTFDETKDYTSDLSGHWAWIAKRLPDKQVIGKGQFIILQKTKGSLVGINQIQEGMSTILPKGVNLQKATNLYLKGIRDNSSDQNLQFTIRGNGLMIDNISSLSNRGQVLKGHGFSILSTDGQVTQIKPNGQFGEIEYEWEAVRITG